LEHVEPCVESAWSHQRLKLQFVHLLSSFAFHFKLRPYTVEALRILVWRLMDPAQAEVGGSFRSQMYLYGNCSYSRAEQEENM